MTLSELCGGIRPASEEYRRKAKAHWDAVAKPLGSLGLLEDAISDIAAMTGTVNVDISRRAVVAMCADNGVVAQGVTQTGQEVTAVVTENMGAGRSSVCRMGRLAGADVFPVDIGVARPVSGERLLQRCVRRGTADFTRERAMTRAECEQAILTGAEIVGSLKEQGYRLLATGEMGIGNTTTSSAVASVLLGKDPEVMTGRGAGLSTEGLQRKLAAIRAGIALNAPDPSDSVDTVSKVGGLDMAGLMGVFLGCAYHRLPVLMDGFISTVSALAAVKLCPPVADYLLSSHVSGEPAGAVILEALGKKPLICAGMRLGEGTGAVAAMPLLDMALVIYREMGTFDDLSIDAYEHLS